VTCYPSRLPVVAEENFTRNFGDEFYCFRRPAYYSIVYAASPLLGWLRKSQPTDPLATWPRTGGGLSMVWTPKTGSVLVSENWSVFSNHMALAKTKEGKHRWPDYWNQKEKFDTKANTITVSSYYDRLPLSCRRTHRFFDDRSEGHLELVAEEQLELATLEEQLPLCGTVRLLDDAGKPVASGRTGRGVTVINESGLAVLFRFSRELPMTLEERIPGADGNERKKTSFISRVALALPATWKKGEKSELQYTVIPCQVAQLKELMER